MCFFLGKPVSNQRVSIEVKGRDVARNYVRIAMLSILIKGES